MKIPETFSVFGTNYKVVYEDTLVYENDCKGEAHARFNVIKLQSNTDAVPVLPEQQEQTFFHELVHIILDEMDEATLSKNEQFVTLFSKLLHQCLTS